MQIDQSIKAILERGLKRATELLSKFRDELNLLADELVAKETLDDDEIRVLLRLPANERPLSVTG
jgi:cell division protease FtsH